MKLFMNELGLLKSECGCWGIRKVNDQSWAIQYRPNSKDAWSWNILEHQPSQREAITRMNVLASAIQPIQNGGKKP